VRDKERKNEKGGVSVMEKRNEVSATRSTNLSGLWTASYGEIGASLKALEDHGVTTEHLARLRAESDYAKRVAEFMLRGGLEGSVHQKLARAILGKNFFGIEEWATLYGVNFTNKQLREVANFPWNEDVLNTPCPFHKGKSIKETHFAFLGLDGFKGKPLTIIKWQELHSKSGQPRFYSYAQDCWYAKEKFAINPTCRFRWYLMPLEIIPDSTEKTYQEQVAMLPAEYEVPLAIEEVTKLILYYRKNGIYLNQTNYGRCQDVTSDGSRVYVGRFDSYGLDVSYCWDDNRNYNIGLAASRNFFLYPIVKNALLLGGRFI